jgi:hypothetical protein
MKITAYIIRAAWLYSYLRTEGSLIKDHVKNTHFKAYGVGRGILFPLSCRVLSCTAKESSKLYI